MQIKILKANLASVYLPQSKCDGGLPEVTIRLTFMEDSIGIETVWSGSVLRTESS
jgi:hypothetical protein